MIPQIGIAPAPPVAQTPEPAATPAPARGDVDAAVDTRVTTQAVEPPRQPDDTDARFEGSRPSLTPPDPDAPTGPPPAFEASVLDRQREIGVSPPEAEPDLDLPFIPPFKSTRTPEPEEGQAQSNPYNVPPAAADRAEADVAAVRRIEAPYDPATVDVAR